MEDNLNSLISEADRCVMCGMCLATCPTYRATLDENESPRGRVALIRALARGDLELSPASARHLDNCLNCRACERVCPSKVAYGDLLDNARHDFGFRASVPRHSGTSMLLGQLSRRRGQRSRIRRLLSFYQASGVRALARGLKFFGSRALKHWDALLPKPAPTAMHISMPVAAHNEGKRVALFTGCVTDILDRQTVDSAQALLGALGYQVVIPDAQRCCGALRYHAGDEAGARRESQANLHAFEGVDVVLSLASGCTSMLREYRKLGVHTLADRVHDVVEFLAGIEWPDAIKLAPLAVHAAVHEPCSMRNVLRAEQSLYKVLARIPELQLTPLDDNAACCGAAGRYMLDHPREADAIRETKLVALDRLAPDLLLSNNIGCALHIASGLRRNGQAIAVLHPVTLLAKQVQAARDADAA